MVLQLHKLKLSIGKLADGYKKAGQFVQVKIGDSKPGFFAIASPPDSNSDGLIEVLIKDGGEGSTANLLCNISTGKHSAVHDLISSNLIAALVMSAAQINNTNCAINREQSTAVDAHNLPQQLLLYILQTASACMFASAHHMHSGTQHIPPQIGILTWRCCMLTRPAFCCNTCKAHM